MVWLALLGLINFFFTETWKRRDYTLKWNWESEKEPYETGGNESMYNDFLGPLLTEKPCTNVLRLKVTSYGIYKYTTEW